jgi:Holliday junction resolvase
MTRQASRPKKERPAIDLAPAAEESKKDPARGLRCPGLRMVADMIRKKLKERRAVETRKGEAWISALTVGPEHIMKEFEDIKSIEDLQRVSREAVWQNFERLTAFIFQANDFQVKINAVRTSNKKRRQYDVIAKKRDKTFLIECKKWAGNRRRLSALKRAVEQHRERTEFYRNLTNENVIPIIVTFIEEEITFFEEVPVVPILKLNSFINEEDRGESEWTTA